MSKYRRAAKVDNNQPDIVTDLQKLGFSVELDHDDILVGAHGKTYWYEIKNPEKLSKKGELYDKKSKTAKKQKLLKDTFKGHYKIVSSLKEILNDIRSK